MRAVIMKYVDYIGALHGIAPHKNGWQLVEKIHGETSPWPTETAPVYELKREALMWLDSYARTFRWKEVRTFDV